MQQNTQACEQVRGNSSNAEAYKPIKLIKKFKGKGY